MSGKNTSWSKTRVDEEGRVCTCCGEYKLWGDFFKGSGAKGRATHCKICIRTARKKIQEESPELLRGYCNKYEKTHKGFIMRLYRNMKSRIEGVQKVKFHLYEGKELLPKEEFYDWALNNEVFLKLFTEYELSGYEIKLAPSVDRIKSSLGYSLDNMEFVTQSENSRRGSLSKRSK